LIDTWGARSTNLLVIILIQAINFGLKKFAQVLVDYIGYDTYSQKLTASLEIAYVAGFINTAIIPVLTNANFEYI
jgi:hypothetical protein